MTISTFATHTERRAGAGFGVADRLGLAAAPTFAVIALMTGLSDGEAHDALCATLRNAGPLSGMTLMYLLMSVFHTPPWLRLIAGPPKESRHTCHSCGPVASA